MQLLQDARSTIDTQILAVLSFMIKFIIYKIV